MSNSVTVPQSSVASGKGVELTRLIQQARGPNKAERDAAFEELYRYVSGPMKGLLAGRVARQPGPPVPVTEAINDAVASLFLKWKELTVNDTGHFRALVVQAVYWKASAQRRANRRLFEAITDDMAAPQISHEERHAQVRFEEAVEALAEFELAAHSKAGSPECVSPTPLADVVKARHLIGLGTQTASDDDPPSTPPPPRVSTFEAIGELLQVDTTTANKRYWQALEWLHQNFPDVVPKLPERKKSGRKKKLDDTNRGTL